MALSRKTIVTTVIIILLIAIGIVGYLLLRDNTPQEEQTPQITEQPADQTGTTNELPDTIPDLVEDNTEEPVNAKPSVEKELLSLAYYFVERWGTFSSTSNYQNIDDLETFMTDDFYQAATQDRAPLNFSEQDDIEYVGYTTKVTNIVWQEQTSTNAEALVTTRRSKQTETDQEFFNQALLVRFVRTNDQWKVTEAVWQE